MGNIPIAASFGDYKSCMMALSAVGLYLPLTNVPAVRYFDENSVEAYCRSSECNWWSHVAVHVTD